LKKFDPSIWFWLSLAVAAIVMGVRIELLHQLDVTTATASKSTLVPIAAVSTAAEPAATTASIANLPIQSNEPAAGAEWSDFGPPLPPPMGIATEPDHYVVLDTLRQGDSIYLSLKRNDLSERQISLLNIALGKVFNASSKSRPKDYYQIVVDTSGVVRQFLYTPYRTPEHLVLIEQIDGKLVGKREKKALETRQYIAEVYIEDNLTNAIRAAGEDDGLTDQLTEDIFGSVIDFSTHPRKGDRIRVLFEKKYLEGNFIRYGSVLVADYQGQIAQQKAFRYTPPGGSGGYYDGEGKSLARMFLLYPLQFRGINSHFNRRRFHPVLKRPVPHLGTDYAASRGEPVHTTAIGTVTHAGRKGGYGLLVEVKHPKGYRTRYAHLSKITVKNGQRVAQRQGIGRVGTTGRSTGPHLHYEIIKNGRHINPTSVNRGERGKSLDKKHLANFATHRDSLLNQLNAYLQRAALAVETEH
jgi:murein DD-endopeptidase MepM/ murein hydrolase activator NlpD